MDNLTNLFISKYHRQEQYKQKYNNNKNKNMKNNNTGTQRVQNTSIIRKAAIATTLCVLMCDSNEVIILLHWLYFATIELYCHLLDFKMYGIVERRLMPRPNAIFRNIRENESKIVAQIHYKILKVLALLMLHPATKFSWKFGFARF